MNRAHQAILIGSTLLGSWLGMQVVHESGHVLGAWLTGGRVTRVVLWPLTISRTDVAENPSPLVVAWAGPVVGVVVPLVLWGVAAVVRLPCAFVLRFFAGFCLLANGLYLGFGSFDAVGDCGELLRCGAKPWHLWLFGLAAAPTGLLMWHRQGSHFGLGETASEVSRRVAYVTLFACLALLAFGLIVGGE